MELLNILRQNRNPRAFGALKQFFKSLFCFGKVLKNCWIYIISFANRYGRTFVRDYKMGFTLIEILIALSILIILFALGLFISFDFYKSYSARSEKEVIVSTLQKARSESIDNISQTAHSVHFSNNPLTYTLMPENLAISAAYNISITSPALPFDVSFTQLSGDSSSQTIILSNGENITINSEGRIDW